MSPRHEIRVAPALFEAHYAGQKKLSRLPRRTAIVAFSAEMPSARLIRILIDLGTPAES